MHSGPGVFELGGQDPDNLLAQASASLVRLTEPHVFNDP
jgi:hypothetical protein